MQFVIIDDVTNCIIYILMYQTYTPFPWDYAGYFCALGNTYFITHYYLPLCIHRVLTFRLGIFLICRASDRKDIPPKNL